MLNKNKVNKYDQTRIRLLQQMIPYPWITIIKSASVISTLPTPSDQSQLHAVSSILLVITDN